MENVEEWGHNKDKLRMRHSPGGLSQECVLRIPSVIVKGD